MAQRTNNQGHSLIKQYTNNSTIMYNAPLFNRISHHIPFNSMLMLNALDLQSHILLGSNSIRSVGSASNTQSMNYYIGPTGMSRLDIPKGNKVLEMAFTSATTLSLSEMFNLTEFFDKVDGVAGGPVCCFKWFRNERLPLYKVPQTKSHYPNQSEIIIPFDIVTESRGQETQHAVLFNKSMGHQTQQREDGRYHYTPKYKESDLSMPKLQVHNYRIVSRTIDRELMDFINLMLYKYYLCGPDQLRKGKGRGTAHDWMHISSVIIVGCVLYAGICENMLIDTLQDEYELVILACLFHDCGRDCRDGQDLWEQVSADIAEAEISHSPFSKYADKVYEILIQKDTPQSKDWLYRVYLAYKSADSVDISRVMTYSAGHNPLNAQGPATFHKGRLAHLVDDDVVTKYKYLAEIISHLVTGHHALIDVPVPEDRDDAWFKVQFSDRRQTKVGKFDEVLYQVTVTTTLEAPPIAELYTGTSYQVLSDTGLGTTWSATKHYFVPIDDESKALLISHKDINAAKEYLTGLIDCVTGLPDELKRLFNDVDKRFIKKRDLYLFDYYCTLFHAVVHYHPLYHRYLSYIKLPFYTRPKGQTFE